MEDERNNARAVNTASQSQRPLFCHTTKFWPIRCCGQGFFFKLMGWDFGYCGHYWHIVPASDDKWGWLWRNWWNKDWQEKPKYLEKTCPSVTLPTTNPTWLDPGLNPGRRSRKPATNQRSCIRQSARWISSVRPDVDRGQCTRVVFWILILRYLFIAEISIKHNICFCFHGFRYGEIYFKH
jgi:hypothetical protein